jgi:DNA-binding IclR family transcriptional regulator
MDRIVAVLDVFDEQTPSISITELARRAGLPRATAHRMVHQLHEHGYLEPGGEGWRLSWRLFELGSLVERERRFREISQPYLLDLFERTHKVVNLGILAGSDVLYLEKIVGLSAPKLRTRPGGRRPLHSTALGKAILAFSTHDLVIRTLNGPLVRRTSKTQTQPGILQKQLQTVREKGYALESEESRPGFSCIAAPIIGQDGLAVAAVSIAGTSDTINVLRHAPIITLGARNLSDAIQRAALA